jgi:hypothetical protein
MKRHFQNFISFILNVQNFIILNYFGIFNFLNFIGIFNFESYFNL